jgi:hypothetical protein
MQASYVAGVAALATAYRIDTGRVHGHHEWAPGREIPPVRPLRHLDRHASWGWSDADGVAGPHTWSRLQGGA